MNLNDSGFIDSFIKNNFNLIKSEIQNDNPFVNKEKMTRLPDFSPFILSNIEKNNERELIKDSNFEDLGKQIENFEKITEHVAFKNQDISEEMENERARNIQINKIILGKFSSLYHDSVDRETAELELQLTPIGYAYLHDNNGEENFVISVKKEDGIHHYNSDFDSIFQLMGYMQKNGMTFISANETKNLDVAEDEELAYLESTIYTKEDKEEPKTTFNKTETLKNLNPIDQTNADPLDDLLGSFKEVAKAEVKVKGNHLNHLKNQLMARRAELINQPQVEEADNEGLDSFYQKLSEIKDRSEAKGGDLKVLKNQLMARRAELVKQPQIEESDTEGLEDFNAKLAKIKNRNGQPNIQNENLKEEEDYQTFLTQFYAKQKKLDKVEKRNNQRIKENRPLFNKWVGQNNQKIMKAQACYHGEMSQADAELKLKNQPIGAILAYYDPQIQNVIYSYKSKGGSHLIEHAPMYQALKGFKFENLEKDFNAAGYTFINKNEMLQGAEKITDKQAVKLEVPVSLADFVENPKTDSQLEGFFNKMISMMDFAFNSLPSFGSVRFHFFNATVKVKSIWENIFA